MHNSGQHGESGRKKYSRLAILSFALGLAGAGFVLAHAGWLLVVAIPLGMLAAGIGGVGIWSISKAPAKLRGRGLAIAAAILGVVVSGSSFLVLMGLFLRQFNPAQQGLSWNQAPQVPASVSINSMPAETADNFSSNLPILVLDTAGHFISKEAPTAVRAEFFAAGNGRASLGAKPAYQGLVMIHLHGTSTLRLPKPSYTFHTVDAHTNNTKVSLLGLPQEESWVLYAPFEDKTLMRDVLAYELANKMGHYAPRTRYVEVFVHASRPPLSMRDYAGVYVLIEKIKRSKDRVNLAKLEPQDRSEPEITGGYIVKRDHSDREGSRFRTRRGGPYFYVYPKAEKITPEQKAWLTGYLNSFESALYGEDFRDPQTGYAAYLDVDAFIDAHWLIEMGKNVDGFRYSAFLTKDRGGKLKPEPPWDWNRSFGNANYYDGWQAEGWYWTNLRPNEISWYRRLREDSDFGKRCAVRWRILRQGVFDPKKINALVDELAAQLEEAQQRNFKRWPVLGQSITCNHYVGRSYQDEVRWMKNWIERRIAWMDSQLGEFLVVD